MTLLRQFARLCYCCILVALIPMGLPQKSAASEVVHEVLTGLAHSPIDGGGKPSFSYWNFDFRTVWQLTNSEGEQTPYYVIGALWLGRPVGDFGTVIAGSYAGIRREWFLAGSSAAVYLEVFLGILVTDAHDDKNQNLIGSFFEFHEDLRIGYRAGKTVFQGRRPFVEIGLQHISNAGLSKRNQGVNSVTLNVGFQL